MNQVLHIQQNKAFLDLRWKILRSIREFFWSELFVEVETPLLLRLPGQEPYLSPMKVTIHDEQAQAYVGFLHTSPEYAMKKMLAAGYEQIFFLGKTFRDGESFGGTHNPEFTMLEWYRTHVDFWKIMDDVEALFAFVSKYVERDPVVFERLHMRDVWKEYVGVNLDDFLTQETMLALCRKLGFSPEADESYEDLFYRIFLNRIEPKLSERGGVIVHHYPACMAALSRFSETETGYAERFEVYIGGIELANAFSELTDATEQKKRLEQEQQQRADMGKEVFALDREFVAAVEHLPGCSGIALGVDRLVQYFAACQDIDSVLVLPASKLFS